MVLTEDKIRYESTVNNAVKPLSCVQATLDLFGSSVLQIIFEICPVAIIVLSPESFFGCRKNFSLYISI